MHSLLLFTCQRAHMVRMNVKTVLISGVRIGGPTLAFWLRAAGFEPTLIERAPGTARRLCHRLFGVSVTTSLCT